MSKNPLLDLYDLIEKGHIQKDIEHQGKVYTFRSLNDEDLVWRDQFVVAESPLSLSSSQRAPTLAVATVAIDGVAIEDIEGLANIDTKLPQIVREMMNDNKHYLAAANLLEVYRKLPRKYIVELYNKWLQDIDTPSKEVKPDDLKNS